MNKLHFGPRLQVKDKGDMSLFLEVMDCVCVGVGVGVDLV